MNSDIQTSAPNESLSDEPKRSSKSRRKSLKREAFEIERAAVRCTLSKRGFNDIERLREKLPKGPQWDRYFWRTEHGQMLEMARCMPDSSVKMLKAKIGAVGTMLGLPLSTCVSLAEAIDMVSLVSAAIRNRAISEFQNDVEVCHLWTEASIRSNPPLRVEFDHATVFGRINEAGDIAKSKDWGTILAIRPLQEDDALYPRNISYRLKETSKLRLRWEVRDTFKAMLGKRRCLVNEAMRSNKASFLADLSIVDAQNLRSCLDLTPDTFWRMVRRGDSLGTDGIESFFRRLEEKIKGYTLPFPEPPQTLIQIQLSPRADCSTRLGPYCSTWIWATTAHQH